uniref:Uncharacterized protein n=1 Tax=Physcomitrium patens TaxID=3218 RepID=A0A2K1K9Y0_PHYPA|nr:hypothetical protein PHYPA_009755 [Physcomitrium patens]
MQMDFVCPWGFIGFPHMDLFNLVPIPSQKVKLHCNASIPVQTTHFDTESSTVDAYVTFSFFIQQYSKQHQRYYQRLMKEGSSEPLQELELVRVLRWGRRVDCWEPIEAHNHETWTWNDLHSPLSRSRSIPITSQEEEGETAAAAAVISSTSEVSQAAILPRLLSTLLSTLVKGGQGGDSLTLSLSLTLLRDHRSEAELGSSSASSSSYVPRSARKNARAASA